MTSWYMLRVENVRLSPGLTHMYFYQLHKNELYISPHVKLAGHAKEAYIEDKKTAQEFMNRCIPIFKRRYGEDTTIEIIKAYSHSNDKKLLAHIEKDTLIIKARIKQNNMIPNKKVIFEN